MEILLLRSSRTNLDGMLTRSTFASSFALRAPANKEVSRCGRPVRGSSYFLRRRNRRPVAASASTAAALEGSGTLLTTMLSK